VNHLKQEVFYSASGEDCTKTKMNEIFVYMPIIYLTRLLPIIFVYVCLQKVCLQAYPNSVGLIIFFYLMCNIYI